MQPINMELNQLIQYIRIMKERRGFNCTSLEQEFVLLGEEVGELAHEVWRIAKQGGRIEADNRRQLGYEVVDCLIFLLSIAGMAGIDDIEQYLLDKEAINTRRFE